MSRKDWDSLNSILIKDAQCAAARLEKAWGKGDSQGVKFAWVLVPPAMSSGLIV